MVSVTVSMPFGSVIIEQVLIREFPPNSIHLRTFCRENILLSAIESGEILTEGTAIYKGTFVQYKNAFIAYSAGKIKVKILLL